MTLLTPPLEKVFKNNSKLIGIHFAIVVDNSSDPDKRGGIRVKIPGIFECQDNDISALPLIYPKTFMGGTPDNNEFKVPQLDTQILVEFSSNDPLSGFYVASLVSAKSVPDVFKEDYPSSFGSTWADKDQLPSWFKINKSQAYIEIFLNPSKSIIRIDKEGKLYLKVANDISLITDTNINLIATKNINLKANSINQTATNSIEKITNKNGSYDLLNLKSTSTNLDLGVVLKKTISEIVQTGAYSITVPQFIITGIANITSLQTGILNNKPLQAVYTGATYTGDPYVPLVIPPVTIPPQDIDSILSAEQAILNIKTLVDLYVTDYANTSELMRNKSIELRTKFKAMAKKMLGDKNHKLDKSETNYLEELDLAENALLLKASLGDLDKTKLEMNNLVLEAQGNLGSLTANYATKVSTAHSSLQDGFDSTTDYKDVMNDFDHESKVAVLDSFNQSAPPDLKLTPPKGASSFAGSSPDILGEWLGSVPTASILPVFTGTIFNLASFVGLDTWVKTNILTKMASKKQKKVVPGWTTTAKNNFNTFISIVRQIEIISCKIYELIKLIERLIEAIKNLDINFSKLLAMLTQIEIILPTWILDLIKDLINQVSVGDLPKFCTVGTVSPDEIQSLPSDIAGLLGKQNSISERGYRWLAHFETVVDNIKPATDFLNSATEFSQSDTDVRSGITIIK